MGITGLTSTTSHSGVNRRSVNWVVPPDIREHLERFVVFDTEPLPRLSPNAGLV